MNTIVKTTESNTAILQLPEETKTLIKASIAENTLKAYQRALQILTRKVAIASIDPNCKILRNQS